MRRRVREPLKGCLKTFGKTFKWLKKHFARPPKGLKKALTFEGFEKAFRSLFKGKVLIRPLRDLEGLMRPLWALKGLIRSLRALQGLIMP